MSVRYLTKAELPTNLRVMSATAAADLRRTRRAHSLPDLPIEMTVLNGHGAMAIRQIKRVAGLVLREADVQLQGPSRYEADAGYVARLVGQREFSMRLSYVPAEYAGPGQPIHSGLAVATFGVFMRGQSMKIEAGLRGEPTAGIQFQYQRRFVDNENTDRGAWRPTWAHAQTEDGFQSVPVSEYSISSAAAQLGSDVTLRAAARMGRVTHTLAEMQDAQTLAPQIEAIGWTPLTPVPPRA